MRYNHQTTLLLDGLDTLFDGTQRFWGTFYKESQQMSLARTDFNAGDHLERWMLLLCQQIGHTPGTFNMIMIRNRNDRQSTSACLLDYLCRAGPAIAEVGMHMDISLTISCSRWCAHK